MQEGKTLVSQHICTAFLDSSLFNNAISTNFQVLSHFEFYRSSSCELSADNWQDLLSVRNEKDV